MAQLGQVRLAFAPAYGSGTDGTGAVVLKESRGPVMAPALQNRGVAIHFLDRCLAIFHIWNITSPCGAKERSNFRGKHDVLANSFHLRRGVHCRENGT